MEFLWWQVCIITLCKGLAWTFPIIVFFLGVIFLVNWLLKDDTGKIEKALSHKE